MTRGPDDDGEPEFPPSGDPVFRSPLPPEDRLWRHPSEVGRSPAAPSPTSPGETDQSDTGSGSRSTGGLRTVSQLALAGMAGALVALAVLATTGDGPSVVRERVAVPVSTGEPMGDRAGVAALVRAVAPALAMVESDDGTARRRLTAIVLRSDGHLLTSAAAISDARAVRVQLADGSWVDAAVLGSDLRTDVAVLHVDRDDLVPATTGSTDDLVVGDAVVAVGALSGGSWDRTAATGIVSALHRRLARTDGSSVDGVLLLDRALDDGVAGGAVVDERGAVVAMASALTPVDDAATAGTPVSSTSPSGDRQAYGAAVPIESALAVAEQLIEHGAVESVWMGLAGTHNGSTTPDGGVLVAGVVPGGPSEVAGLAEGDIIVAANGHSLPSMDALLAYLHRHRPDDELRLEIRRDGRPLEVVVVLGTAPAQDQ